MKFFVDSSDVTEIMDLAVTGLVDGVTTNPSLLAKSGRDLCEVIAEICRIVDGPVSAQVVARNYGDMVSEGQKLREIADNVVVKLPLTAEGLLACNILSSQDIRTNITLCFSANQALLAAKAGATYVSPFIGRLDDIGQNGMQLIEDILRIYRNYSNLKTEVLVASVRNPEHVYQAALLGAHVATIPPNVLRNLINHPLTDKGLEAFQRDSTKSGQRIL